MSYRSIGRLNLNYTKNILEQWFNHLPYIKPYYAIKSFPNKELVNLLSQYNLGFDCASMNEIKLVKDLSKDIIYANPTKSEIDIIYAKNNSIKKIVIDSIEEIKKIQNLDYSPEYVLRIVSDESYSSIRFNRKFGASLDESKEIISFLKENNLNLTGFSYHVGSKCSNMKAHLNTINNILENLYPYCLEQKLLPSIIDIGGGFENEYQIIELNENLKEILPTLKNLQLSLIAEPGRLFSQGALEIETEIIAIREKIVDKIPTLYLTINDSVYHSFQGKMFDGQTFDPIAQYSSDELIRCIIFGNTCDSLDLINENCLLPRPKVGDKLLFKNMGAYSLASAEGNFNGFYCAKIKSLPL